MERIEAMLLMSRERMVLSSSSGQFTAPDTLVPIKEKKEC
jgi:hypothetical protein